MNTLRQILVIINLKTLIITALILGAGAVFLARWITSGGWARG